GLVVAGATTVGCAVQAIVTCGSSKPYRFKSSDFSATYSLARIPESPKSRSETAASSAGIVVGPASNCQLFPLRLSESDPLPPMICIVLISGDFTSINFNSRNALAGLLSDV